MIATLTRYVAFLLLPGLVVLAVWVGLFLYRPDYIGHTLAGYGGTLCAMAAAGLFVRLQRDEGTAAIIFLQTGLLCILLGAIAEATVFRLAIFDPIDFCLQSLGAVLAAFGAIMGQRWREPSVRVVGVMFAQGGLFLVLGIYYAFYG